MIFSNRFIKNSRNESLQKYFRSCLVIAIMAGFTLILSGDYAVAREKPADMMFNAADTDHNGLISEKEWHEAMQKRIERIDTNKDGNISKKEFEEFREEAREKFRNRRN